MDFSVRHGIAFRTAFAVIGFSLIAGLLSIGFISYVAYERSREDVATRLQGLLDTVASTASIACFVEDRILAKDIANGLMKNTVVRGVTIRSSNTELINLSQSETPLDVSTLRLSSVSRKIVSPFDSAIEIGEILVQPNLDEVDRINRKDLVFIGTVLVVQLIIIILAAIYAVFRWIVLPMKGMSDMLHKMSDDESGALPTPAGHETTEIGRLVKDINELTSHLAEARKQAENASQAKGNFLANMSHEIRTPINAVVGMAHLALKTGLTDKQRDYVEKIRSSGSHLLDLVNEVLDVAKIEAGKFSLENTPFNLQEMINRLQSIAELKASEKGLSLNIDVDRDIPPFLSGDSMRIGQILLNYINNAIKFTVKGSVNLQAHLLERDEHNCLIRFEISDTGIGLSAEQISRLFQSFEQADASTTRKFGGTGLGLSISKQLAEMMGGNVGVDSEPGQGSTFWATVRVGIAPAMNGQDNESTDAQAGQPLQLGGLRILLAEDNLLNQQIARELLEEHGVIVSVANNGREAINQLEGSRFDCVLMDVRMPEMDGLEATELIRANPDWREIPIIAMTANARTEDRRDCLAAGMNDFISKPVDPEQFFSILQKWLKPLSAHPSVAVNPAEKTEMPGTDAIASTDAEIDTRIIAGMVKNNPVKIVRFTQVFLDSTGPGMVNIQQALAVGDCEGLIQLGHRFKSSAKSMGALRFGALLAELETSAQAGDLEKAKSLVDEINASWQRVEAELKDFIALQENA